MSNDDLTPATTTTNSAAEAAVLGAMMLSAAFAREVAEELTEADFAAPAHRTIFAAIQKMLGMRRSADPVAVAEQLREEGLLVGVGGAAYIHMLVTDAPLADSAEHWLEILRRLAILRGDRWELATVRGMREVLVETLEKVEHQHNDGRTIVGVPTGFPELDRLTSGLQPGNLIVIASRPSVGKSTLAQDFARNAAVRAAVPTLLCSLEQKRTEVIQRMMCAESTVDLHRLRTGRMEDSDWTRLTGFLPKLAEAPLFIDDSVAFNAATILTKARKLHRNNALGLLIVDPIQALLPFRPVENLYEQASASVRGLKVIARELDIPVVGVSNLSRHLEARTDKKPILSDLRDSGALEDTADLIIFVYREDLYDPESPRRGEADLILAKHRNGPTDTVTVAFQGQYARFTPILSRYQMEME